MPLGSPVFVCVCERRKHVSTNAGLHSAEGKCQSPSAKERYQLQLADNTHLHKGTYVGLHAAEKKKKAPSNGMSHNLAGVHHSGTKHK